ncbi:uncharacterized protein SPSK_08395 [Sporothrix schenckii 1099-18]|uniref:Cell wall proline rich protein n=1 Tax=Sporothrix schenckii 1099-18 TaxID=1397361 RepID=A0A0F2M8A2_SPOSC|nr:uncharacterized protein SPSK_08395 [Sporothrix schenckii 1099-18]KJR84406.1 hypothetical protein SPSK_08395 [Sporothrix schenckii 1099-18]
MATALSMDVPPVPAPPQAPMNIDAHVLTMATASEPFAKPSSPRPIPSPVSIPPRFDDDSTIDCTFHSTSDSNTPASPRFQHIPPPPPIPDFVFPARPSTSAPSSYSRATGRRPKSVADLNDRGTLSPGPASDTPIRTSRSPALPDFSFNPGASLPPTAGHAFLSPPLSPHSPRTIPSRPGGGGHRRGGSEFVGGSVRHGEAFTFMSTSPTKSESGLASPLLSPLNSPSGPSGAPGSKPAGPPHGRRGHAHRRSAAISSHDISDILQPTSPKPPSRGNSAPNSPSAFDYRENKSYTFPERNTTESEKALSITDGKAPGGTTKPDEVSEPEASTPVLDPTGDQERFSSSPKAATAQPRARVGFSDTLEFIPRPLSLVSSDTSSTMTARPPTGSGNHSVSGSISSIVSLNASIAAGIERDSISPLARSPSRSTVTESRPSTAGAVLDRTQSIIGPEDNDGVSPRRRNSIPLLAAMPAEAAGPEAAMQALPSPSKTPKRWSFFSLDPFIGGSSNNSISSPKGSSTHSPVFTDEASPTLVEIASTAAPKASTQRLDRCAASTNNASVDDAMSLSKTVTRKPSNNKKKKKVKSWGILGRKSKPRRKSRRAPTPPPIRSQAESDGEESIELPAEAIGLAISEPSTTDGFSVPPVVLVTPSGSPSEPREEFSSWQPLPSPSLSVPDDDASLPMIDLDAALGPFNTPLPRNAEWEAAQRAGGLSKRQLHSAAGMTRFTGPGMHYSHRRAESAPEMPPFNRAGIPRFSSSTAMADVFEEEEEEENTAADTTEETNSIAVTTQEQEGGSKSTSVHSTSSLSSTPPRQPSEFPSDFPDHHSNSIDIRVTSSDGAEGSSYDRGLDFSSAASDDATSSIALSRRGSGLSGLSDDDKTQPSMGLKSEYSASSLHDDVIVEEDTGSFTFGDDGCDFVMESSSDSTIHSPGRLMKGKDLAPVEMSPLHLPATGSLAPVSPYSMAPSSAFPSPRSPMSYDANRISTAPSSVTEDNFQSLLLGEPGPEVRISSDIPSLTSSNSTMTRESAAHQNGPQYPPLGGQPRAYLASRGNDRPASFTSTAFGRRRSSLASLHRLISTSHGERSKLSMEVQLDSASTTSGTDPEKKGKYSKAKRISRMVQFWRAKDEATS